MALIRISESEDWIVDYDKERGMYRVSYFENNHFVDECWFDCYEEKELASKNITNFTFVNSEYVISDDLIPHGKWLNEVEVRPHLYGWVPLTSVVCSACNTSSDKPSKFCPNCGTKMI